MNECIIPVMSAFSAVVFRLSRNYGEDVQNRPAPAITDDTSPDYRGADPEAGRPAGCDRWRAGAAGRGGTPGLENDTQNKIIIIINLLSNLLEKNETWAW